VAPIGNSQVEEQAFRVLSSVGLSRSADILVRQRAQHAHYLRRGGTFALRAQADRMSAIRKKARLKSVL